MPLAEALALADTSATVVSLICAALAYRAIRRREIERHKRLMIAAVAASAITCTRTGATPPSRAEIDTQLRAMTDAPSPAA